MTSSISTVDTPVGPFMVIVDGEGSVLASGWTTDAAALLALVHPDLRGEPRRRGDAGTATRAVRAYLDGDLTAPDGVPVRQHAGGAFLPAAWAALRKVAPGEPVSYTEFAALAGRPAAVRAAAQACARNAAALFVPCHRVIRGDGSMGGFRWGLDTKLWLLAYESAR
ncbi:MAG: methylated-DNA--[protein]-cysteine S-methyltransferase [Micromonosporaceae bacterium]